jgi:TatD DNase family protein
MTNNNTPLIDIGANLSHSSFSHDLDEVLQTASAAGVAHIIVTGTDIESINAGLQIANDRPDYMSVTAGFHPHVASKFDAEAEQFVRHHAANSAVVAIGEMGLDFNRNYSPQADQERAFTTQLEIATQVRKPVFLHQRDAHARFLAILKQYRSQLTGGVVHCFTDSKAALHDYLDLDMYIGVTGWICDERRGKSLQALVSSIPQDRLLLETDAPYLLPRNLDPTPKSRRNEPKYLVNVLTEVAKCTGKDAAEIAIQTTQNARRLFELERRTGASD